MKKYSANREYDRKWMLNTLEVAKICLRMFQRTQNKKYLQDFNTFKACADKLKERIEIHDYTEEDRRTLRVDEIINQKLVINRD